MWGRLILLVAMAALGMCRKPPCQSAWFGCPTHNCRDDWETCGFGVVDKSDGFPQTTLCCHSIGNNRQRVCRYRSTYHREYPENGNWWDQYCLPIYPSYS